jgi:hypothetical protein
MEHVQSIGGTEATTLGLKVGECPRGGWVSDAGARREHARIRLFDLLFFGGFIVTGLRIGLVARRCVWVVPRRITGVWVGFRRWLRGFDGARHCCPSFLGRGYADAHCGQDYFGGASVRQKDGDGIRSLEKVVSAADE